PPAPSRREADVEAEAPRAEERPATPDPAELWRQVLAKIPQKSFLSTLTALLYPSGTEGRNFVLAHLPNDRTKIETLATANNRRQLEALLKEASGCDWSLKFVAREGIAPVGDIARTNPGESFQDDPVIQEAIELFNAKVRA
ncbi:MAG: hypothetical protein IRY93_12300, partial [Chthoniobacterales bacterium]|nr:hypothetical protein [Chthoniobacterales bacterium]